MDQRVEDTVKLCTFVSFMTLHLTFTRVCRKKEAQNDFLDKNAQPWKLFKKWESYEVLKSLIHRMENLSFTRTEQSTIISFPVRFARVCEVWYQWALTRRHAEREGSLKVFLWKGSLRSPYKWSGTYRQIRTWKRGNCLRHTLFKILYH